MGATSMNLPAIFLPAGPMLRGNWRGEMLGSGSDAWKYWAELRAGTIDDCAWREIEDGIARSFGTCMTMGTASTMARAAEALGLTLPGASSIPAADSRPLRAWRPPPAGASSRWCWEDLKPRDILTTAGVRQRDHAPRWRSAARPTRIIHLIAMAGRAGRPARPRSLRRALARDAACSPTSGPSGEYLMEDFFYAGGLPALLARARATCCTSTR